MSKSKSGRTGYKKQSNRRPDETTEAGPEVEAKYPIKPESRIRIKRLAPVLLFWLFGVINLFHPVVLSLNSGDVGDTRLVLYFLEHQFKVMTDPQYPGHFATAPFWFPESANNMARSEMLIGALPFYILPRLLLPRDTAFEAFFVIVATLNFIALYWLLRSLQVHVPVAALAAFVFAFGMHKVQHTVHAQLFLQFWGVMGLFCIIRFLQVPTHGLLFWSVLLLGLQTLSSLYSGFFYLIGASFLITVYAVIARDTVWKTLLWCRHEFFALVGAVTLGSATTAVLLLPYARTATVHRSWEEISLFIPTAWHWIDPLQGTLWWFLMRPFTSVAKLHETVFLGATFLILAVCSGVAFWSWRAWRTDVRGQVGFAFFTMSLGLVFISSSFLGHTPWILFYRFLPGATGLRDISRVSVVVNAGVLISGALFLDFTISHWRKPSLRFLLASCIAFTLAENCLLLALAPPASWRQFDTKKRFHFYDDFYGMYTYPRNWYAAQATELANLIRGASAAYIYPDPSVYDFSHETNAELISQQLDVPVMNGYTGSSKPGYEPPMSPHKVLEKGTEFDFDRFAYLVPRSEEQRMRDQIEQAGLSFLKGGEYFSLYTPLGQNRTFDVDFEIAGRIPDRMQRNHITNVAVVVTNRSQFPWQPFGDKPTHPAYQVLSVATGKTVFEGMRTSLPEVLFPGEKSLVQLALRVVAPGNYILRLAMVQEKVCWFLPKDHRRNVQFPVVVE